MRTELFLLRAASNGAPLDNVDSFFSVAQRVTGGVWFADPHRTEGPETRRAAFLLVPRSASRAVFCSPSCDVRKIVSRERAYSLDIASAMRGDGFEPVRGLGDIRICMLSIRCCSSRCAWLGSGGVSRFVMAPFCRILQRVNKKKSRVIIKLQSNRKQSKASRDAVFSLVFTRYYKRNSWLLS